MTMTYYNKYLQKSLYNHIHYPNEKFIFAIRD